jgi:hypothetical protein
MSTKRKVLAAVAAALLGIAVAVVINAYREERDFGDTLEFAAALIGGAGIVFGALYAFLFAGEQADQSRRRRALELIDQLNTRDLASLRLDLEDKIEDWKPGTPPDSELEKDAYYFLGLLEDLALAIRIKDADEFVLYQSLSFLVPRAFSSSEKFIIHVRHTHNDLTLLEDFEKLSKCWTEGKSYCSGKELKGAIEAKPVGEPRYDNGA